MRRLSFLFSALIALLLTLGMAGRAPAAWAHDEATPTGESAFPITPDAADCQIEPRSTDELIALWFEDTTPAVGEATPASAATVTELTIPVGAPADAATVAAVTDTVQEIFGCFAAGSFPRAFALFSDDLIRGFGPEVGESEQDVRDFIEATPEAGAAGEVMELIAITNVMDLEDGRVGAIVVNTEDGELTTVYVIFQRVGDRLLVDEIVDLSAGGEDGE